MNCKQCKHWSMEDKHKKVWKYKGVDIVFRRCLNELLGTNNKRSAMLRFTKGPTMTMAKFGCNFGQRGRARR